MMVCSSPEDCAEIERRHSTGIGLLADGGAIRATCCPRGRGTILTVSRMEAEKRANPGYRAFLANGSNVTQALVLFMWEVLLEWTAQSRSPARCRPRGHRRRLVPLSARRAVRDRPRRDRVRGADRHDARPPRVVRHVFELRRVAHHSGSNARTPWRRCASSTRSSAPSTRAPARAAAHEIVVLSDHGQTQGPPSSSATATASTTRRAITRGRRRGRLQRRRRAERDGRARRERSHGLETQEAREERRLGPHVLVLGSGNLGSST